MRFARCSPMPDNSRRSRGDKNSFSLPAATSRKPGLAASVASFANQRESAKPPDNFKPTSRDTVALNSRHRAAPSASADKSKNPSSMDTGTTNGENRFITANIRAEICRYSSGRAGQMTNSAHKRRATKHAMPDLTPNSFARRFADSTIPFCRRPPATINARLRNAGDKISSHVAKKLSASQCKMRLAVFINNHRAKARSSRFYPPRSIPKTARHSSFHTLTKDEGHAATQIRSRRCRRRSPRPNHRKRAGQCRDKFPPPGLPATRQA